jgi:hypothetical protein
MTSPATRNDPPREIACPRCHGALRREGDTEGDVMECTSCRARFPVTERDVIDFLSQPEQNAKP